MLSVQCGEPSSTTFGRRVHRLAHSGVVITSRPARGDRTDPATPVTSPPLRTPVHDETAASRKTYYRPVRRTVPFCTQLFGHAWVRSSVPPQTVTRAPYGRPTSLVSTKSGDDAHASQHATPLTSNGQFRCPRCGYDGLCKSRRRWYDAFRGTLTQSKPYRCAVCRSRRWWRLDQVSHLPYGV